MADMYLQDLTNATEIVLDANRKFAHHTHWSVRSKVVQQQEPFASVTLLGRPSQTGEN
jgi:hypothetical protein